MIDKQEIKNGMKLKGLGPANVDPKARLIKFDAILNITAENADKLGF
jgi:hypothetical protein